MVSTTLHVINPKLTRSRKYNFQKSLHKYPMYFIESHANTLQEHQMRTIKEITNNHIEV